MKDDYNKKTPDELQSALVLINDEIDELKEEARVVRNLRDAKLAEASAKARYDAMSESEKAAMAQQIKLHGIGPAPVSEE